MPVHSKPVSIEVRVPHPLHRLYESPGLVVPDPLCILFGWQLRTTKKYMDLTETLFTYLHTHDLLKNRIITPNEELRHAFHITEPTLSITDMGKYLFHQFSSEL